jgi:hypothetical protein
MVIRIVLMIKNITLAVMSLCNMDGPRVHGTCATHASLHPEVIFKVDLDILGRHCAPVFIHDVEGDVCPSDIELVTVRDRGDGSRQLQLS